MAAAQHQFSGHESFPLRYLWLKKGFDAVRADGGAFLRDDAVSALGVGKNMVRAIRHWGLAAGVLEEGDAGGLRPSALGELLLADGGLDPFLEDPATLWLVHWHVASSRSRATTWFWAFSHFHEPEFSREALASALFRWSQTLGGKLVAESSVRRDVDVFLRTYAPPRAGRGVVAEDSLDCPLVELGLISPGSGGQTFRFNRGLQPDLPDGVLVYATLAFWDAFAPAAATLAVADLARLPGSPGRLFKIDESSLIGRLERVEAFTGGAVSYGETAGLRQLSRRRRVDPLDALARAYAAGVPA